MLSAGAASANITPDPGMINWVDHKPYDGVLDPLFARALVLSDDERKVALLCWDLIDTRDEAVARVRQAIREATGVPEAHVMVHASHTHSGPRSPFTEAGPEPAGRLAAVAEDPIYQAWAERLPGICAGVVKQADAAMRPAAISIGRAAAAEWLFNRRPRGPDGAVTTMFVPQDPYTLPDGLRFGPLDPTLTVVVRDLEGHGIATLFHLPCHPVSIYPHHRGISGDWPGPAAAHLASALGGEALFLQGCAGDVVPARRGVEAREEMARFVADRALAAAARAAPLPAGRLSAGCAILGLPLAQALDGSGEPRTATAEIQAVVCGTLAIVALPGEPLIELAMAIQARSPFPHTIVVGYANGRGVGYVGMPGEKARGGYEARTGRGADECGGLLVETAARLLQEQHRTL